MGGDILQSSNPPQTLSGIETGERLSESSAKFAPTHPKPSQGLKPERGADGHYCQPGSNPPQTLSGIETRQFWIFAECFP